MKTAKFRIQAGHNITSTRTRTAPRATMVAGANSKSTWTAVCEWLNADV